jgi:hypothetical protein
MQHLIYSRILFAIRNLKSKFLTGYEPNEVIVADIEQDLNIFPNPAHSQIELNNLTSDQSLQIEDMYGKICKSIKSMNSKMVIDVQDLNSGIYIIRCFNRNPIKFIKQ